MLQCFWERIRRNLSISSYVWDVIVFGQIPAIHQYCVDSYDGHFFLILTTFSWVYLCWTNSPVWWNHRQLKSFALNVICGIEFRHVEKSFFNLSLLSHESSPTGHDTIHITDFLADYWIIFMYSKSIWFKPHLLTISILHALL